MKIHVLGIPHTQTNTSFTTCAYTMKVYNLCRMMKQRGHEVIHYGTEGSSPSCSENVAVMPEREWRRVYGARKGTDFYDVGVEGEKGLYLSDFARSCQKAMKAREGPRFSEIVCCPWGIGHREAVKEIEGSQYVVESGIGYAHTFCKYRVFESYSWLHFNLGKEGKDKGRCWYDVVIPNAFDTSMFQFHDRSKKKNYFLYIGRLIDDKGVRTAIEVAKELGKSLVMVGQGDPRPYLNGNPHVEYRPPVGVEERSRLMGEALCVFVPTYYVEPFGGVNVEAQLCGTPVITTDWGAFSETVLHGVTGFRCHTFDQFVWAARHVEELNPGDCRQWASANYSLERVGQMYEEYFQMVSDIGKEGSKGWYERHPERRNLDWLKRYWPA